MSDLWSPESLAQLCDVIDQRHTEVRAAIEATRARLDWLRAQSTRLFEQGQLVRSLLGQPPGQGLLAEPRGVPAPAQPDADAETMYLGTTPEESFRAGGSTEPTF